RTDSRPFSYLDAQGRPVGYTIELCERIARSLEAQLNVALRIKWVAVDQRTRFDAIINDTADMECGSTTVSPSRMKMLFAVYDRWPTVSTPSGFVNGAQVLQTCRPRAVQIRVNSLLSAFGTDRHSETWPRHDAVSACDPKRTMSSCFCCDARP